MKIKGNVFKSKKNLMEHIFKAKAERQREQLLKEQLKAKRKKQLQNKKKREERELKKRQKEAEEAEEAAQIALAAQKKATEEKKH